MTTRPTAEDGCESTPPTALCAWWLRNRVCMPRDWRNIEKLYEEQHNDKGRTKE